MSDGRLGGYPQSPARGPMVKDLASEVEKLASEMEETDRQHAQTMKQLQEELKELNTRAKAIVDSQLGRPELVQPSADDSTFIRRFDWRIRDLSARVADMKVEEAIWSEEFKVMGLGMQLEFFPRGRKSSKDGWCALFFWCPAGVSVKYQLRIGAHQAAPDTDEYASRMGYGHSNFCILEAQRDKTTDTVDVSVEILAVSVMSAPDDPRLKIWNRGPEQMVGQEAEVLLHRDINQVDWKIKDIARRRRDIPQGLALVSPSFSIAGMRGILMEFYPNGLTAEGRKGYCGFYVRCPAGSEFMLTLFVGKASKGPTPAKFTDNVSAKGLPEFCLLDDQIEKGEQDLVIGIKVRQVENLPTTLIIEDGVVRPEFERDREPPAADRPGTTDYH